MPCHNTGFTARRSCRNFNFQAEAVKLPAFSSCHAAFASDAGVAPPPSCFVLVVVVVVVVLEVVVVVVVDVVVVVVVVVEEVAVLE